MARATRRSNAGSPPVDYKIDDAEYEDKDDKDADVEMDEDVNSDDDDADADADADVEESNELATPQIDSPAPSSAQQNSEYEVLNDEYQTPNDANGDMKISALGELQNNRQFRMKTFKVPGRGDRLYAISTDVARLVGYRDSYFLFQRHTSLFRVRLDDDTKFALINDDLLPSSFKTRAAYLITARSAFKEFGSKLILGGKQITDDYYEDKARANGAIEGALVNPVHSKDYQSLSSMNSNSNLSMSLANNSTLDRDRTAAALSSKSNIMETKNSWIYDHALKCRQFDSMLLFDRNELLNKRVQKDIYTNLNFTPSITQPTKSKVTKISDNPRRIIVDTIISDDNLIKTGLKDVPLHIFDGLVDDSIKEAILAQQRSEGL